MEFDQMTWKDVIAYIQRMGFDQDEYFSLSIKYEIFGGAKEFLKTHVWTDETSHVDVAWRIGGNEGYYVHVDTVITTRREFEDPIVEHKHVLTGKFWDPKRAALACASIQWYINMQRDYEPHSVG